MYEIIDIRPTETGPEHRSGVVGRQVPLLPVVSYRCHPGAHRQVDGDSVAAS